MNKKNKIIVIVTISVILLCILAFIVASNREKVVKCKYIDGNMELTFKKNNLVYIEGTISSKSNGIEVFEQDEINNNVIKYNKKNNTIKFSIPYKKHNERALNYIGFNYNNSSKYKDIIKSLEDNNYYCE